MLLPDYDSAEIAIHALQADQEELIAGMPDGQAARMLRHIEEEGLPLAKIPAFLFRSARVSTISIHPPPQPS